MKVGTENVKETEASAELIRELMSDDARRGNWLILMHDDDEGAFMQIAFDDHPDGIELEYREGMDTPLYHCRRPVLRLEAAQVRCRLELQKEDRAYHRYGNGGLGTRMCVLVAPEDYKKASGVAL